MFLGKKQNQILISINGIKREIELMHVFKFDSDRKRMSIIVKDCGIIKLYCKVNFC